ncbi:MAG: dihydroxyacetone kinase subunit DhaL [Candidatus Limnocylindrales bacterium]
MNDLRACVLAAADAVEDAREELGILDGIAGDGDHGTTMTIGARNVRQKLQNAPDAAGADLVRLVALGMGSVGGAIGPIYATGLLKIVALLKDVPTDTPLTVTQLRACVEAAEAAIAALGKAKPGDKTIIDAIQPLAESLRMAEGRGDDLATAIRSAASAARQGANSTAGMIAAIGRASRLGERSRGYADPGATSFAIVVEALAKALGDPASAEG